VSHEHNDLSGARSGDEYFTMLTDKLAALGCEGVYLSLRAAIAKYRVVLHTGSP